MVVQTEGQRSNNHKKNSVIKKETSQKEGRLIGKSGDRVCRDILAVTPLKSSFILMMESSRWAYECALFFFTASLRQCFSIKVNRHLFSASLTTLKHLSYPSFCSVESCLACFSFTSTGKWRHWQMCTDNYWNPLSW